MSSSLNHDTNGNYKLSLTTTPPITNTQSPTMTRTTKAMTNRGSSSNAIQRRKNNNNPHFQKQRQQQGRLRLIVLSAYDLPEREPPAYIQLEIVPTQKPNQTNNNNNNTTTENNDSTARRRTLFRTGPPVQRHKDRNSFKFHSSAAAAAARSSTSLVSSSSASSSVRSTTSSTSGEIVVKWPTLAELYQSTAVLTVVYPPKTTNDTTTTTQQPKQLSASYPLNQLLIHETTWLILNLSPVGPDPSSPSSSSSTSSPSPQQQQSSSLDDDDDEIPPTLRLQMTLDGPYRTEIGWFVQIIQWWLQTVSHVEGQLSHTFGPSVVTTTQFVHRYIYIPPVQWFLIPAAPLVATLVVCTPIAVGVVLVTLPFSLPLLVGLGGIGISTGLTAALLYSSTTVGRHQVATVLSPIHHAVLQTHSGQTWIYQTGPRPTAVQLLQSTIFPRDAGIWSKLVWSLVLDGIGSMTYLLPLVGELLDLVWAPVYLMLLLALYDHDRSSSSSSYDDNDSDEYLYSQEEDVVSKWILKSVPYLGLMEELLPFTDIVPSATIGWLGEFAWPFLKHQLAPPLPPPQDRHRQA